MAFDFSDRDSCNRPRAKDTVQQSLWQITDGGDSAADMQQDSDRKSHLASSSLRAVFTHKSGLNQKDYESEQ